MMNKYHFKAFALTFFFFFFFTPHHAQTREEIDQKDVRPPAVAGKFYPDSPAKLTRTINSLLESVPDIKPDGKIVAALAPHAGYVFSGSIAAYTHKVLSTVKFDTLVIIGHDTYQNAVAYTCPVDYFQTPLGKVPVDREMIEKMHGFNRSIKLDPSIHAHDHTIELHLPFLQVLNRQCKIIPILFGNPTAENCRVLADAILAAADKKSIFILASTDMSHYPPYEPACRLDNATLDVLRTLDVNKLFAHLAKGEKQYSVPNLRTLMCASGGVGTAILWAKAKGADHAHVLRYANSGDVPEGDKHGVVGYCSVLIVQTEGDFSK
jgi:AmmeMemoRadiSam system protein B